MSNNNHFRIGSTLFNPGGNRITNQHTTLFNTYVSGSGVGASSISNRRAKKNRAAVCCQIPPEPNPTIKGNLIFSLDFSLNLSSLRNFNLTAPLMLPPFDTEYFQQILPIIPFPGVFQIYPNVNFIGNKVIIEIQTFLNKDYPPGIDFGITFDKTSAQFPDIDLSQIYNELENLTNLTFIRSTNCPFTQIGAQFSGLNKAFNISNDFKPYFLPGTSLANCFADCIEFNSNVSQWDTTNVVNMSGMFSGAAAFDQDISSWNTSNVGDMSFMFYNASAFNRPINTNGNYWNTSKVTNMRYMFYGTSIFNQDISSWDTSNVTKMDYMFSGNIFFNQNINTKMLPDNSKAWDTKSVTDMAGMFQGAQHFNNGDTNNTGNYPLEWDTSQVIFMYEMFFGAENFNQPVGTWNVEEVITMFRMFRNATNFKQNISNWKPYACKISTTSEVETLIRPLYEMFLGVDMNNPDSDTNQDNYNALLTSWGSEPRLSNLNNGYLNNKLEFHAGTSKYSSVEAAIGRANLDPGKLWEISDGVVVSPIILGSLRFSYNYIGPPQNDEQALTNLALLNLPVITNPDVFIIVNSTVIIDINTQLVDITINSAFVESDTQDVYGFTFNIPHPPLNTEPTPDTNLTEFYRTNTSNLTFIESTNFPFSKKGYQFASLRDNNFGTLPEFFIIQNTFIPYFLPGTSLNNCFYACTSFNSDISSWVTQNVTDMSYMFSSAYSFNGEINTNGVYWNTSNVTNMEGMFVSDYAFNENLGLWDTSEVTNMSNMFGSASSFISGDITSWNTSKVENMSGMFSNAINFNVALNTQTLLDGSKTWDTSNVTLMTSMFNGASVFNQDISSWVVGVVTDMSYMFSTAEQFNNGGNPLTWDTKSVNTMNFMFYNAYFFDQDISSWDTREVTTMSGMFFGASVFDHPINTNGNYWNTSKVEEMDYMFAGSIFNRDISSWDVGKVKTMAYMFSGATNFNQNINTQTLPDNSKTWDTKHLNDASGMFQGATNFNNGDTNNSGNYPLEWDTSKVDVVEYMFSGAENFNQPIGTWDTSKVTTMNNMFSGATNFNQNISLWDTSIVENMETMFYGAKYFNLGQNTELIEWNWNTSKVKNMAAMFGDTDKFNQNINTRVIDPATTYWNTSEVTNMISMFSFALSFNQNILLWDTRNVEYMDGMFSNASAFDFPLDTNGNTWNTSSVLSMQNMFSGATEFNQNISSWDVGKVTNMAYMFSGATKFKQYISNWSPYLCTTFEGMFQGVDMNNPDSDQYNYNALLVSWGIDKLSSMQTNVKFHAGSSRYSTGYPQTGRSNLINIKNWTITQSSGAEIPVLP